MTVLTILGFRLFWLNTKSNQALHLIITISLPITCIVPICVCHKPFVIGWRIVNVLNDPAINGRKWHAFFCLCILTFCINQSTVKCLWSLQTCQFSQTKMNHSHIGVNKECILYHLFAWCPQRRRKQSYISRWGWHISHAQARRGDSSSGYTNHWQMQAQPTGPSSCNQPT